MMRSYRRIGIVTAALAAGVGLAGCGLSGSTGSTGSAGQTSTGQTAVEVAAELSPPAQALAALGFDPDPAVTSVAAPASPQPSPSSSKARPGRHKKPLARVLLRRNTLHGEVVVQGKGGATKTVTVQRGEVTAIGKSTVTVKSTDGFTLTWTFGDPLRVVEHRTTVQPEDVAVGAKVGVAGAKDGDRTVANLLLIQ